MKYIKLVIIIGIAFFLGALTTNISAYYYVRYIQVPEYVSGYSTLDLLNYLASLKAKEDSKIVVPQPKPVQQPTPVQKPIQPQTPKSYKTNASA